MEEETRACLANLVIGIERRHIAVAPVKRRLAEMAAGFQRSRMRDFRDLLREHDAAFSAFGTADHYHRPGPLNSYLDSKAVTFMANEDGALGQFWLRPPRRAGAAEIEDAFGKGECVGTVGRTDRPIWLTPLVGEVDDVLQKIESDFSTPAERAGYTRRIVALLGLSHFQPTVEVVAMVTKATIGELLYERPDDHEQREPVGSTAIEARGHRRFRAWPTSSASPFGRTFDMDDTARATAGTDFGVLEIVRPCLEMAMIERCVFLGSLTATTSDRRGDYLKALGVHDKTTPELLLRLADMTGL